MVKLLNGDCLELMKQMKDKSVDLILTDPPYGMNFQSCHRKEKYSKIANDVNLEWLPVCVSEMYRIAKENTAIYIFCSYHNIDIFKQEFEKMFEIKNLLVWIKNNWSMGDLDGNFASKTEFILFATKGRPMLRGKRDYNTLYFDRTENKLHPTQKPVDLCEFLLTKFTNEGDTVLDPFMGSGTTGVAAKKQNRNFIGIELNQQYFITAEKRINNVDMAITEELF